jgi:Fuc2NAc and GlcNAc transferase
MSPLTLAAIGTALVAGIGTAMLRTRAAAWGLIDIPNERSLHSRATPRGGGIVLVAAVLAGYGAMVIAGAGETAARALAFAALCAVVAAVGWRDDLRPLSPQLKLLVHVAAAAGTIALWGAFDRIHVPGVGVRVLPPIAAVAITGVWLVGLLNAYNFMDGIDGIASGQAVVAGVMWAWACGSSAPLVAVAGVLIAAASIGFLWHNWAPAAIFLGDAGSGFLGFAFAALPLVAYQQTGDARFPFAGVLMVGPFVFDTIYTLCRRLRRGENVVLAHRTHLYQRLVTSGWSHQRVASLYLALGAASATAAVLWLRGASGWVMVPPVMAIALLPLLIAAVESRRAH